ncbi:MAG TPA: aminomethyltransferase beta-barrel domain-containing protein, partial [Candidatus Acidoferrales bacterium]|nr:aminomethyltransferase beta-barrel domain-containing protein [Candidatus Acidoferrales bacterium]
SRRLVVGDDCELFRDTCEVDEVNWISVERLDASVRAEVKIRHRHEPAAAWVEPAPEHAATSEGNDGTSASLPARRVRLRFDAPQRAITPGQAAVFYQGESVLGGGWIQ